VAWKAIVIAHRTSNRGAAVRSSRMSLTDLHLPLMSSAERGRGA
jgi:hypothetical protein